MIRLVFILLFLSVLSYSAQGQQVISSTGGIFQNNRINCQVTVGEVMTDAQSASVSSSIQVVPGIFFPSDGVIPPVGITAAVLPDMDLRFSSFDRVLHISQPGENLTECGWRGAFRATSNGYYTDNGRCCAKEGCLSRNP